MNQAHQNWPAQTIYVTDEVSMEDTVKNTVNNQDIAEWSVRLHFTYQNDLLYYIDNVNGWECLCIPACFKKKIFELVHDKQHYDGFHCTYNHISASLFLYHLTKHLKAYILHCSECQLNQMKWHSLYGSLNFISTLSISFYTVMMNFVLTLSQTTDGLNNLFTVTDKFMKWVLLLPEKSTYSVTDWANVLLLSLIDHDWDISHQIISDCDCKFLSFFWQALFKKLDTKLLISMTYHSQTDSQSKHINQMVEITLCYFLISNSDKVYITVLPYL